MHPTCTAREEKDNGKSSMMLLLTRLIQQGHERRHVGLAPKDFVASAALVWLGRSGRQAVDCLPVAHVAPAKASLACKGVHRLPMRPCAEHIRVHVELAAGPICSLLQIPEGVVGAISRLAIEVLGIECLHSTNPLALRELRA